MLSQLQYKYKENNMLLITRKVGQEFTATVNETEIKFIIKRVRGEHGHEKVEIMAIAPPSVKFQFTNEED